MTWSDAALGAPSGMVAVLSTGRGGFQVATSLRENGFDGRVIRSEQSSLTWRTADPTVPYGRAVVRGDPAGAGGGFCVLLRRRGRLVGVEAVNRPFDPILAREPMAGAGPTVRAGGRPGLRVRRHAPRAREVTP